MIILIPTVGRIVYYMKYGTPGGEFKSDISAAMITRVHNDTCIDLCVINPTGFFFNQSVVQGDKGGQWNWMPYQVGQAAKTEELQSVIDQTKEAVKTIEPNNTNNEIKSGLDFGEALSAAKNGKGFRLPQWAPGVVIRAQVPDAHSKMTAPYLYVESVFGKVPWRETFIELFAENYVIVE